MSPSVKIDDGRLDALRARSAELLELAEHLVAIESPSHDTGATAKCSAAVADIGTRLLGQSPESIEVDGVTHLRWQFGSAANQAQVVLVGHYDTVWPNGTLERWPFSFDRPTGIATGPGLFDMKAGIAQMFGALSSLDDLDGVAIVLTADEEVGSITSAELVRDTARGARAALVCEPAAGDALKTARKGTSDYRITVEGLAAHAGLEPEKGRNASIELAHQILAVTTIGRPEIGTTVTPTVLAGGTTTNTVPASAWVSVDSRASEPEEQRRVDSEVRDLEAVVDGCRLHITGGINRPPMAPSASAELFPLAVAIAEALELPALSGVNVGGGSDGNFTAGEGVPTLDGLGAVGGGAHAEGEWIQVSRMPERAALLAELVAHLLRD